MSFTQQQLKELHSLVDVRKDSFRAYHQATETEARSHSHERISILQGILREFRSTYPTVRFVVRFTEYTRPHKEPEPEVEEVVEEEEPAEVDPDLWSPDTEPAHEMGDPNKEVSDDDNSAAMGSFSEARQLAQSLNYEGIYCTRCF
jgi:hypothetical protein